MFLPIVHKGIALVLTVALAVCFVRPKVDSHYGGAKSHHAALPTLGGGCDLGAISPPRFPIKAIEEAMAEVSED